jgi:hypothetical protein
MGNKALHVLIFNTTGNRSGPELLEPLTSLQKRYEKEKSNDQVPQGPNGHDDTDGHHGNFWDLVMFVPNDSTLNSVERVAAGDDEADYTWQHALCQAWEDAGGHKVGKGVLRSKDFAHTEGSQAILDAGRCRYVREDFVAVISNLLSVWCRQT